MNRLIFSILFFMATVGFADTPPPGVVKAKLHDGSGNPISSTSGSIHSRTVSSAVDPVFNQIVNGGVNIDPRAIRALTAADVVSCQQSGSFTVSITGAVPLPTGAATEATLVTVAKESGGNLESIADDTALVKTAVQSLDSKVVAVNTGAVVVSSSALPTGAATQATLATRASEATLATRATEATLSSAASSLSSIDGKITTTVNGIRVDVGGATFTANSDLNDGAGNPITSTVDGAKRRLDVDIDSPVLIEGGNAVAVKTDGSAVTQPISASTLPLPTGASTESTLSALNTKVVTTINGIKVDGSAITQPVSAASLPLPSGAATEATLSTRATEATQQVVRDRVADINSKLNTLGQKTMAASAPVVIASDQSTLPVSGTVLVTGVATEATLSSLNAKIKAYDVDTSGGIENVQGVNIRLPGASGSVDGGTATNPIRVDPTGTTTQPVSVASLPLPSGGATAAKQDVGNASLSSIDSDIDVALSSRASESTLSTLNSKVPSNLTVTSTRLLVDGSGVTQPVSASSLPLPTGAATSALQTTGNSSLSSIDGKLNSLGQKLKTGSVPVVLASDQDTLNVAVTSSTLPSGAATESTLSSLNSKVTVVDTGNVTVIASALPSGAATSANQTTGNASLSSIDSSSSAINGKLNSLGQKAMTGSVPVVIASDQSSININNISGTVSLPTGASTAANQTTGNSSLSSIDGKFNSLGQKTMAASTPVVISSDQSVIPVSQSGNFSTRMQDGSGNALTSQVNGSQRALDVGVNVAGVQVDPRSIRALTASDVVTANQGGAPWSQNVTQFGSSAVVTGTGNGGSGIPRVTVSNDSSITNISGTISLPTGASTSANQTTGNASLSSIDGKLNSLGQKTMSGSVPVAIASDQTPVQTVGNVASAATDSGNPVKIGGVYNTTAPTFTNGQRGDIQLGRFGGVNITENTAYSNITTATTTTVKSSAGVLYKICYNKIVNNATVTIYDNTTATAPLIGTVTQVLGGGAVAPYGCEDYGGVNFNTGLTIVTSAAVDITVMYK